MHTQSHSIIHNSHSFTSHFLSHTHTQMVLSGVPHRPAAFPIPASVPVYSCLPRWASNSTGPPADPSITRMAQLGFYSVKSLTVQIGQIQTATRPITSDGSSMAQQCSVCVCTCTRDPLLSPLTRLHFCVVTRGLYKQLCSA